MPFFSRKKPHFSPPLVCTWSAHAPQSGPSPSPLPRSCYTLTATAPAAATGEFFFFGGCESSGRTSSDLHVFSTREFSTTLLQTSGEVPTPRASHGAVLFGTTLLICGGSTTNGSHPNALNSDSLCLLNLESREWSRVVVNGPGPDPRIFHTTAVVGSKIFVFGGEIGGKSINDMWTLDFNSLKSQPVWESYESTPGNANPLPRSRHVSVTTEGRIIIFGGYGEQNYYNDTWSFDISTRQWTEVQCTGPIPSPRACAAAVLVDDVMYVFGGFSRDKGYLGDLYALQFSTQRWFKFHNVGPSPHSRSTHSMASDGTRVFVLGGYSKDARADDLSHIHFFDTKSIMYPEPERKAVNPNEKTTQLAQKSSTGPTLEQPQGPGSSSSKARGSSRLQNATAVVSGCPASKPRQVPEDDVGESSTEYHGKSATPHSSVEGELSRLEFERQPSVLAAAQTERDQHISQLTDELALKSTLLEQAEANATEATKRVGLHADRLLMQTSLVEQRDAELVDMQARLDELQLSRDKQEIALQDLRGQFSDSQTTVLRLESENKRITRQLNEAADQHKYEAERLKSGIEDLKANHETAIERARKQAASLQRDKSDLQQNLDTLKAEVARLNRRLLRMGSPMTPEVRERSDLLTPNDRELDDISGLAPSTSRKRGGDTPAMFPADGNFDSSPDVSSSRLFQAPNHPNDEVEALQQYEKELMDARAKLEAKESELEAVQSRLTDAEKGLTESKAEADTLRAQTATGSVNRDEDQITRRLLERVRAIEAEIVSKRWNKKSIEEMECRNEG